MIGSIFSDDGGSDSSADDGLPKHLEAIAAAKVNCFIPKILVNNRLKWLVDAIEENQKENKTNKNLQRSEKKRWNR